jgi:hypothetical protein
MHGRTPCPRSHRRNESQSYARSATNLSSCFRGRPRARDTRMLFRAASASFTSARSAPVTRDANGITSPSVAGMRFVPLPTLARPTSSPPVCRNEAAIEERPRPVQLPFSIQAGEEPLPDPVPHPFPLPPLQPPPRCGVRPVLLPHVLLPASCPQDVQDPIEHLNGRPPAGGPSSVALAREAQSASTARLSGHSPSCLQSR